MLRFERTGPKFDAQARNRLAGLESAHDEPPTWRGWCLGLFCCALLAAVVPYVDFIIRCTRLTLNLLPASSMVLVLLLILGFNLLLGRWRAWFRLTRQDLVLVFCMTMIMNAVPGSGFMNYLINGQLGLSYYATPENNWRGILHPLIPEALAVRDPYDPNDPGPRPAEWYFSGLPQTGSRWETLKTMYLLLAPPFLRWGVVLVFICGLFFALTMLLYRQWGDRERLPFPLPQVPQTMMSGLFGAGPATPFVKDRLAWLGIGLTFVLHSYNAFGDYVHNWAPLAMRNDLARYLTEIPWRYLQPFYTNIFPSVIAFMYFVSLEVSFSLWFFYLVVMKIGFLIACGVFGLGESGSYFNGNDGTQGIFTNQGAGALVAMVVAGFVMARTTLWQSLRQALGLAPREEDEAFSPRTLWTVFAVCLAGAVGWLAYYGITWYVALLLVLLLLIGATGVARLVSEGGMLLVKGPSPVHLLQTAFTPVQLGPQNYALVNLTGKVFQFDDFRMNPMINVMSSLHLASLMKMRPKPLIAGLAAALAVCFVVVFFSYHTTCALNPGGARLVGWAHGSWAPGFYRDMANRTKSIQAFEARRERLAKTGQELPESDRPEVARTDWTKVTWLGVGAGLMSLFLFLRTRLFWWPHPMGYVMWLNMQCIFTMWFSYFLGWLIKALILKFGGMRAYASGRRFFVGLVVGEALATLLWIFIAWLAGVTGGYAIEYN